VTETKLENTRRGSQRSAEPQVSLPVANQLMKPTLSSGHVCLTCAAFLLLKEVWLERLARLPAPD